MQQKFLEVTEDKFIPPHLKTYGGKMKKRVVAVFKNMYKVRDENKEYIVGLKGNLKKSNEFPCVGDYVLLDETNAIVTEILERKSKVSRKVAGHTYEEQVIASNIDYIFIVTSVNQDFNIARLERYLTMVYDSGASPVFVLTKSDIGEDIEEKIGELENIAYGVPIHLVSAYKNEGIEELKEYLSEGKTVAMIGSSGVGKSTLLNIFSHKVLAETMEIRKGDDKGKHTTTHRELYEVEGGYIIDTPGMRELQLWGGDIERTFEDIEELSAQCKFRDCRHMNEPQCAVKEAVEKGIITQKRLDSYNKLKKELEYTNDKKNLNHKTMEKKKIIGMMGSLDARKKINNKKR